MNLRNLGYFDCRKSQISPIGALCHEENSADFLNLWSKSVVGNLFTTAGQKRVLFFVAGRIYNSSKHTHIILIHNIFFSSEGLAGRIKIAHRPQVPHSWSKSLS